jgi:integrase
VTTKKTAPIKKVVLADGKTTRYRFVVDVGRKPDGRRDQRTFTYDTLKEAKAEWARIVHETAKGSYVKPDKMTVEEWLAEWLELKAKTGKPTGNTYRVHVLRRVRERFGTLPLQQLDERRIEALKDDMLSGADRRTGRGGTPLSPRSVNAMLTVLSAALTAASKRGVIVRNPVLNVDRVASDPDAGSDRGEWQPEDAVRFLQAARDDRLYAAYLLSMLGLRRGEVLGLRWDHLDLTGARARERKLPEGRPSLAVTNNRVIAVDDQGHEVVVEGTPKGKGRRAVPYLPLPALAVAALKSLKVKQAEEKLAAGEAYRSCPECDLAHVVVNEIGEPVRPPTYSDRFVALGKLTGLTRVPLHGSRHCAASLLADLGVPEVAVAAWLGHTQVQITRGYTHVFGERLAETSRVLGEALGG